MRSTWWILFPWLLLGMMPTAFAESDSSTSDIEEYCYQDAFRPGCGKDEVIVIKHARYGRMRAGRCMTTASSNLGCSVDIQDIIDSKCSGRRACEILHIATITDGLISPCGDLKEYLEVAYECMTVAYSVEENCGHAGAVEVRSQQGFLSSFITQETGCGSSKSPWWITAKPGQHILLRLLDFAAVKPKVETDRRTNICQVYAVVREESMQRGQSICASTLRESLVYTSASHRIEVQLITGSVQADQWTHFLIEFEAIGCPDLQPPARGWMKRIGNDVEMGCDVNVGQAQKWKLRCEGLEWVGHVKNCSVGKAVAVAGDQTWLFEGKYQVLSIMVVISMILCVCLCMLLCAVIYVKRNWKQNVETPPAEDKVGKDNAGTSVRKSLLKDGASGDYYYSADSDYYRPKPGQSGTAPGGSYPPPPYFTAPTMRSSGCTCKRGEHGPEHEYEHPTKKTREAGAQGTRRSARTDPKYYELDPECVESNRVETL